MDFAEEKNELDRSIAAIRRGEHDVAVAGLKSFLEVHPNHEIATGLLAATYFQIGMRDKARGLYEQIVAAHPTNALARFQLGLLRLEDDPREALALWAPLLRLDDEFMAHFHSALAHIQLGESAAAQPLLDHAARYMPTSHPLRDQLKRLRDSLSRDGRGYES